MSTATQASNGQPPANAVRNAAPADRWRWGEWAFKIVPVLVSILIAVISFNGRMVAVETVMKEMERRMDRFEGKIDRLFEHPRRAP